MKLAAITIIFFFSFNFTSKAQISDTALIKKLSVNGVCLCNTPLSALKQTGFDLKETNVEEMDSPPNCFGQDSRYISGKGYYSEKIPGLIFQKDQETDYISKIRLTKQFKGKLPDGNVVNMDKLVLKDLFKLYPKFKDKWGSRGCSDYWNFSNDTISFYVKIDKTKQPQFPIDEKYYLDKPIEGVDLVMSCYSLKKDKPKFELAEVDTDPIFFIDSIKVNRAVLMHYKPNEIASITVYKDTDAIKRDGSEAKNGLIYIETKEFAKNKYWSYFKSKSTAYEKLVVSPDMDLSIQYILNNRILKENYEGDLSAINDKIFKSIIIINKAQLAKDYGITDKEYGVIIKSDVPSNLHNAKEKF